MKNIQFCTAILITGLISGMQAFGQSAPAAAASAAVPSTAKGGGGSAQSEAGEPRASTSISGPAASDSAANAKGTKGKGAKGAKNAADHVDLDTTTVTGNRELPKVMYVVPWKRSDIGDLIGRPANSLLDEVLAPVDRNVFRREVQYYQALKPDSAASTPQGEK